MNIAIISHSAGGGGAERVAVNLANHLLNENEVFEDIGMVAGMKGVAITQHD